MTDQADAVATSWPLAPGEDPTGTLPRLVCQLAPGRPSVAGRKPEPARHPWARYLISPVRVLETGSPDRIRAHAAELLDLADALEAAHAGFQPNPDQLQLEEG